MNNNTKIYVVSGHYGSGKTNIAVNLAYWLKKHGSVGVFDLDVVNPYFRTSDFSDVMRRDGIGVVAPAFANSNLDTPALTGEFYEIYGGVYDRTVVDVGGDDSGAFALGQYAQKIADTGNWEHWYIVNFRRIFTSTIAENIELMRSIEAAGKLPFTGIVNNTNLGTETVEKTVEESYAAAAELSQKSNIPLIFTSVMSELHPQKPAGDIFDINIYTKHYW